VKASCEAFIMAVTKLTVEPMLSFITKVTAVKVAMLSSSKRLREQCELDLLSFAEPVLCMLCLVMHLTWLATSLTVLCGAYCLTRVHFAKDVMHTVLCQHCWGWLKFIL